MKTERGNVTEEVKEKQASWPGRDDEMREVISDICSLVFPLLMISGMR